MPLLILAGLALGVALLLRVAYGPGYLSIDGMWSLQWGSDLWHLRALAPTNGTTPHPLSNLAGAGADLLGGRDGDLVLLGASYLAAGLLVVATGVVAERLAGRVAAVAAAVLVATRPQLLASTTAGMLDVWAAAYVVIAVAAALPRDGDGTPHEPRLAMGALLLAGLLRPEAWALAGAWWLWRVWTDRTPHLGQLAVAVAAPMLWVLLDAIFTGDPLFAIHQTEAAAGQLREARALEGGFAADVERAVRSTGNALAAPLLITVVAAVGAGAWLWRSPSDDSGAAADAPREWQGPALVVVVIGLFAVLIVLQAAGGTLIFPRFALAVAALGAALVAAVAVRVAARLGAPEAIVAALLVAVVVLPSVGELRGAQQDTAGARAAFVPAREALRPGVPCTPVGTQRTGVAIYISRWTGVPLSAVIENLSSPREAPASYIEVENSAAQMLFREMRDLQNPLAPEARVVRRVGPWTVSTTCG